MRVDDIMVATAIIYGAQHDSGFWYVGSTCKTLEKRKEQHLKNARKRPGTKFHAALATSHESEWIWGVLHELPNVSRSDMFACEGAYQQAFRSISHGFNTVCASGTLCSSPLDSPPAQFEMDLKIYDSGQGPLFLAKQIGEVLGLQNIRTAAASLPSNLKLIRSITTSNGARRATFFTEQGVLMLAYRSHHKNATYLQKWIWEFIKKPVVTSTRIQPVCGG